MRLKRSTFLVPAAGTFTLSFDGQTTSATGAGNLSAATGKGSLAAGSKEVTSLTTKTGGFAVGQLISGPGIPSGTTIAKTGTGTLELSQQATEHVSGANLTAGSKTVNDLTTEAGVFAVGESITGSGIPSGTTITEINSGSLELSQPATKAATAEPITAGTILTYDSDAGTVQSAIEGMSTIGPNNVVVSGSVGGPYSVEFVGRLARSAITALTADSSSLTPPGATASVITTVKGGRWEGATEVPCLNEGNEEVDTHPIPSASPSAEVHGVIAGLAAGKNYEYRVTVRSANGSTYGASQPYTTGKVPDLTTDPATNLTEASATLNASFVGDGRDTHYYFEWGPTAAYGNTTAAPPGDDAGSPSGPARTRSPPNSPASSPTAPTTTGSSRRNGSGTSHGQDQMFTTTPGAPTAQSPAVTEVHSDRAVFHGEVNPNGAPTKASFEYVDDATSSRAAGPTPTKPRLKSESG